MSPEHPSRAQASARPELEYRERKSPIPGFHIQAAAALAFVLVGLGVVVLVTVMADPARGDHARPFVNPLLLPFGAGGAMAAVNATLIHQGRRPAALMRFAPLPVFAAVFWLGARLA